MPARKKWSSSAVPKWKRLTKGGVRLKALTREGMVGNRRDVGSSGGCNEPFFHQNVNLVCRVRVRMEPAPSGKPSVEEPITVPILVTFT